MVVDDGNLFMAWAKPHSNEKMRKSEMVSRGREIALTRLERLHKTYSLDRQSYLHSMEVGSVPHQIDSEVKVHMDRAKLYFKDKQSTGLVMFYAHSKQENEF
jgi:hypothetical protein